MFLMESVWFHGRRSSNRNDLQGRGGLSVGSTEAAAKTEQFVTLMDLGK